MTASRETHACSSSSTASASAPRRTATPSAWRGPRPSTRSTASYPHTLIGTSGLDVGLPDGQMGNSEVGHLNLGAGRIVYQDIDAHRQGDRRRRRSSTTRALVDADRQAPRRAAGRCTCSASPARAACTRRSSTPTRSCELAKRRGLDQGLLARVPRRARHAAQERPPATCARSRRSSSEIGVGAHRDGRRALLGDGPRQPLGPRRSSRTTCSTRGDGEARRRSAAAVEKSYAAGRDTTSSSSRSCVDDDAALRSSRRRRRSSSSTSAPTARAS